MPNLLRLLIFACLALLGCSREPKDYAALVERARVYQDEAQHKLEKEFGVGALAKYDWNVADGQVIFFKGEQPALRANVVFAGSFSLKSKTWLWGWDNPVIDKRLTGKLDAVREYGKSRAYGRLTDAKWPAQEHDAWGAATAASFVLKSQGAFRLPNSGGTSYLILQNVRPFKASSEK